MMLAMTFKAYGAQHDHLLIAFDFFEGLLQDVDRVLGIAGEQLLECAGHPSGCFGQSVSIGIIADPSDDGPKGSLHLGSVGLDKLGRHWPQPLQRMHP
jgi:hypothetical protein